jgi:hypothetical protein
LPSELGRESAKTVQKFIVILNEMDREAEEERKKVEREAKRR